MDRLGWIGIEGWISGFGEASYGAKNGVKANLASVSDVIGSSSDTWHIVFIVLIFF